MAKNKKNGPLTDEEKSYIRNNMIEHSPAEMGEYLGRNPETISKFLSQSDATAKDNVFNLKKREDWVFIQGQFSKEELELFEWHWNNIISQLKNEIYHTETMELINAIKHEILGNRSLTDLQRINKQIEDTDVKLQREYDKDPQDVNRIENLERLLSSLSQAIEATSREYRECNKKLAETLKSLKTTRDQRLSRIEDSKKSFPVWMGVLMSDKETQAKFGQYAEKFRMAAEIERQRLGKLFLYQDGKIDRPLFNSDTLKIETDVETL